MSSPDYFCVPRGHRPRRIPTAHEKPGQLAIPSMLNFVSRLRLSDGLGRAASAGILYRQDGTLAGQSVATHLR